ncbi:MAG TPA: methyltransferase domain-containing protein, partial [Myxococcota bacterium]
MDLRERTTSTTQRHPWERARRRAVDALVREHAAAGPLLDVGAGDGFVARHFAVDRDVVAVDAHFSDDDVADLAAAGIGAAKSLPARHDFAVALLLDVIEHVDDDVALLRDTRACLRD